MKLKDTKNLIEYNGDFYTPEELKEVMGVSGDFEIVVNGENDSWFGRALQTLRDKTGDQ